jgi:hypothetical protein
LKWKADALWPTPSETSPLIGRLEKPKSFSQNRNEATVDEKSLFRPDENHRATIGRLKNFAENSPYLTQNLLKTMAWWIFIEFLCKQMEISCTVDHF